MEVDVAKAKSDEQKSLEKQSTEVTHLSSRIRKSTDAYMAKLAEKFGLRPPEIHVLSIMRDTEYDTAKDLARYMGMSRAFMSKVVDSLMRGDYVIAEQDKKDRRIIHLKTTERTNELFEELDGAIDYLKTSLLRGISAEEMITLNSVMQKILENAEELL